MPRNNDLRERYERSSPVFRVLFRAPFLAATAAAAPPGGGFIKSVDLGHGAVTMLSMTSDGSFVSAATQDGTILMLTEYGSVWHYFNSKSNSQYSVAAIHPSGTEVLGASGTAVYMIDETGAGALERPAGPAGKCRRRGNLD